MSDDLPVIPADLRKEFTDYYKWIVTLATFVLTVSLSLSSVAKNVAHYKGWLIAGWILLATCIFFNWLLIKSMIGVAAAASSPRETWTKAHYRMLSGVLTRQKVYGNVQNAAFLLGVLCVGLGYALSL